jgi:hypothetical protein
MSEYTQPLFCYMLTRMSHVSSSAVLTHIQSRHLPNAPNFKGPPKFLNLSENRNLDKFKGAPKGIFLVNSQFRFYLGTPTALKRPWVHVISSDHLNIVITKWIKYCIFYLKYFFAYSLF